MESYGIESGANRKPIHDFIPNMLHGNNWRKLRPAQYNWWGFLEEMTSFDESERNCAQNCKSYAACGPRSWTEDGAHEQTHLGPIWAAH